MLTLIFFTFLKNDHLLSVPINTSKQMQSKAGYLNGLCYQISNLSFWVMEVKVMKRFQTIILWMHSAYKILLLKDKQHIDALAPVIYFLIIICLREGKKWEKGILNSWAKQSQDTRLSLVQNLTGLFMNGSRRDRETKRGYCHQLFFE